MKVLLTILTILAASAPLAPAELIHRWSFNNPAGPASTVSMLTDTIGGAHGSVLGAGAGFTGTALDLPGGSSATAAYVDLPNGLLSAHSSVTIEAWVTVDAGGQYWARIFDFGSTDAGEITGPGGSGQGWDVFMLSAAAGLNDDVQRLQFRNADPVGGGADGSAIFDSNYFTTFGEEFHIVVCWWDLGDGRSRVDYWRNGAHQNAARFVDSTLANLNDVNNWIGRSNWTGDDNLDGTINEFRIWDNAVDQTFVDASLAAGPEVILPAPRSLRYAQDFSLPGGTTVLGDGSNVRSEKTSEGLVLDGQLRMTNDFVYLSKSAYRIPALHGSSRGFVATFNFDLIDTGDAVEPADGFSFNFGDIPNFVAPSFGPTGYGFGEEGMLADNQISFEFDTWPNGMAEEGYNIGMRLGGVETLPDPAYLNTRLLRDGEAIIGGAAELSWRPGDGASLSVDTGGGMIPIFTNVPTPGFVGKDGYSFAINSRTGSASETLNIDNVVITTVPASAGPRQDLLIDFNSTTQDGGPHPQNGFQSYDAGHENPGDFPPRLYEAFGTMVTFTPSWPNTVDARVWQSIDRAASTDAAWSGQQSDLLTDWIGTDARTTSGGNGDYNGTAGVPTEMLFTLADLPPGRYHWRSFHHDMERVNTFCQVEVSTDGGTSFGDLVEFRMTNSTTTDGTPPADDFYDGINSPSSGNPVDLPSTVEFDFIATGDDVVVKFVPLAEIGVHRRLLGCNGFELARLPDPLPAVRIESILFDLASRTVTLSWISQPGKSYRVLVSETLAGNPQSEWLEIHSGILATAELTSYSETFSGSPPPTLFYLVEEL